MGAVKLVINNIAVSNGVVHVIDTVLKPPELDPIVNRTCPIIRGDTFVVSDTCMTPCAVCLPVFPDHLWELCDHSRVPATI